MTARNPLSHPPVRALAALLLAAAVAPAAPTPAPALFGIGGGGKACATPVKVDEAADRTIDTLNLRIDAMEASLVEALSRHAAQTSGYTAQSAAGINQTLDGQTRALAQIEREAAEARSIADHRPTAARCATVTGATGLHATARIAETAARRASEDAADRAANPRGGAAADARRRWDRYTRTWCAPDAAPGAAEACSGPDELHNRDLHPEALFGEPTLAGREERAAALDWQANIALPVVADPPPIGTVDTAAERDLLLRRRANTARTALAADTLASLYGLRVPAVRLEEWAEAMLPPGAERPDGPLSRQELLELLAARRFERPEWHVGLQAMSTPELLRELVTMQALSLTVDFERWELDQRRAAMEAAQLAMAAEARRTTLGAAVSTTAGTAQ